MGFYKKNTVKEGSPTALVYPKSNWMTPDSSPQSCDNMKPVMISCQPEPRTIGPDFGICPFSLHSARARLFRARY